MIRPLARITHAGALALILWAAATAVSVVGFVAQRWLKTHQEA